MTEAIAVDSYFVCATPRTGSSLLLGLLGSTGVAGRPQAYFREPDELLYADRWQLPRAADGRVDYGRFLRAAIVAGSTANGVFGAKLMWGILDHLTDRLCTVYPEHTGRDVDLMRRAFGRMRFVYLRRDDVLAQAVSWVRAEQTNLWFVGGDGEIGSTGHNGREPRYDAAEIARTVRLIEEHNAGWQRWFAAAGIRPHLVRYEDLAVDLDGVTRGVLDFLGLDLPQGRSVTPKHQRQADEVNREWIDRYPECGPVLRRPSGRG